MTDSSNAIDDRTESAKGLAIPSVDGIYPDHCSAYETECINSNLRWARSGVHTCVLSVAEYCRNWLDIAWHLVESISVRNACSRMCADLVGSSSTSLPRGFSRTSSSERFMYDGTVVFKVNHHRLGVVRSIYTLQIQLADS